MSVDVYTDSIHSKATPDLIDKLLAERQQLLVLLNRLAKRRPFVDSADVHTVLEQFCQVLVDYTALGLFEVFQCVEDESDDGDKQLSSRDALKHLYENIAVSTAGALAFNDRYDCEDHCKDLGNLYQDLSRLSEQLATRIDAEDRLIEAITHRSLVFRSGQGVPS